MDKEDLLQSPGFCMLPWVHIYALSNGDAYPCCMMDYSDPYGSIKNSSIEEYWNSSRMMSLRSSMMGGKKSSDCKRCHIIEDTGGYSSRQVANKKYSKYIDLVDVTNKDGHSSKMAIKYLDLRFSNICNFKCRTCGPEQSSHWYSDYNKLEGSNYSDIKTLFIDDNELWDNLNKILPNIDDIYFAGGEPLIMPEHYYILDYLIENGRTDVPLGYNTNLSKMDYGKKSIYEYWNQFDSVYVGASLDGSGKRAEYIRSGTKWDKIVKNRKELIEKCPDVTMVISPTVSIYNAWHIIDFYLEWVDLGLIHTGGFMVNPLHWPAKMSVTVLPAELKKEITEKYRSKYHLFSDQQHVVDGFESIINYMNSRDDSHLIPEFLESTEKLDVLREESFFEVFPELESLGQYNGN